MQVRYTDKRIRVKYRLNTWIKRIQTGLRLILYENDSAFLLFNDKASYLPEGMQSDNMRNAHNDEHKVMSIKVEIRQALG